MFPRLNSAAYSWFQSDGTMSHQQLVFFLEMSLLHFDNVWEIFKLFSLLMSVNSHSDYIHCEFDVASPMIREILLFSFVSSDV